VGPAGRWLRGRSTGARCVTPLGTCAFSGAVGVARLLLEHGADPHIGEDGVYTVEAEAIARGNEELARLIETAPDREEATA
jgi:ankyrin repeat protein